MNNLVQFNCSCGAKLMIPLSVDVEGGVRPGCPMHVPGTVHEITRVWLEGESGCAVRDCGRRAARELSDDSADQFGLPHGSSVCHECFNPIEEERLDGCPWELRPIRNVIRSAITSRPPAEPLARSRLCLKILDHEGGFSSDPIKESMAWLRTYLTGGDQ